MFKAVLYKEWLKIRWVYLAMIVVSMLLLLNILLNIAHDMKFVGANGYWSSVIFRGYQFYYSLRLVPVLIGLVIAFAQFLPEILLNRLKLTLHLPVKENKLLLQIIIIGLLALLLLFSLTLLILSIITRIYFPADILFSMLITSLPWFIAGFIAYFSVSMILIEPTWSQRIILILIVLGFVDLYLKNPWYNSYIYSLPKFILLAAFFSISIILSGNRFINGVM